MSDDQKHPIPVADATRLAGAAYRTQFKTDATLVAGAGYQSILATQVGALPSAGPTERYKIGDRIGGRYEVLAIHRGSMGVVYGTFDHKEQLPRALKTLQERFASNAKMRDLFAEEAATWVQLGKHPFIVRAYLVEKYEGRPYVITEYVRGEDGMGGDLRAWLGHKRLTLKLAVEIALQIAQGMQHAVQTLPGLVHRDLKPANVLVDGRGRAMVTDFGLVCAAGAEAGTPAYMAPELWNGELPDGRTDIYAFGCVLYEMFTGHRMFSASSVEQWRYAHLTEAPVAPSKLRPGIPEEMSTLVMKCLARTQSGRPRDWDEVVNQLAAQFHRLTSQPAVLDFSVYELSAGELVTSSYSLGILKKYEEMLSACDRALKIDPNYALAWTNKGSALDQIKRHSEAIDCYDRALEIDSEYADAYFNKGNALANLDRRADAIACYDRALEIDPNYVSAWINKGSALDQIKRYADAIACYDHALGLETNHAIAWHNRGIAFNNLEFYDAAIACYDRVIAIEPNDASVWTNKGRALASLNRRADAIACYDRALKINPNYTLAWTNKGRVLDQLKRHAEAIECYYRVLEIDPNNEDARIAKNRVQELSDEKKD